ncbi:hypothetical protein PMIN06_000279 [Paraphaeosphaeria minitans]|uniref:C2H2-type domain-containing protein n=1 Tax=Paraphaeosphaeria minitans TaxID=565426 RepID=A0A9P6KMG3_9PLEO|nr:hypothetical protein PMIN01_09864 [Paraphaeosphaeria minitans]
MQAVIFSEVSYGPAPLPKLRTAQECPRRDSLSSSRTQDSGYISDPELSLSPLDFVSPDIPHTSSDFTSDSSALFDVKEIACFRTKRLAATPLNPIQAKKHKIIQEVASTPRVEVTSNPTLVENLVNTSCDFWTADVKQSARDPSRNNIELWVKDNLHPNDRPKERNHSIVSLDSTGSCDMYSNTDDNSDDEHGTTAVPGTLSKAALKTIELILRKIEVNLGHAAYMQCAGGHASRAQSGTNVLRGSRSSQASSGKRKARGSDESFPPDDPDEDDAKKRRVSVTTTTEDSETGPRFACPFFKHDPHRYRQKRTCGGPGWPTVHRMKEHLYRSHAQPIFCPRCYTMFESDADFAVHLRGNPCQVSAPQPIEGIDRRTFESLKKRSPALRLEEDKWRDAYQLLFPQVAIADIPSPYYDSNSPTEESRRFRREVLERIRQELFATAEREPGPVEQRLLRQIAGIIRRCENDILESFYAPPGTQQSSLPPSRRASAIADLMDNNPPRLTPQSQPGFNAGVGQPNAHPAPQTEPVSPRGNVHDPGAPAPAAGWNDLGIFSSSDWIDWNIPFPAGPDMQGTEREDAFMALSAPVWTR